MEALIGLMQLLYGLYCGIFHPYDVKVQDYKPPEVHQSVKATSHSVETMSNEEFAKWVAKQNPHDPIPAPPPVIQYPDGFMLSSLSDGASSSSEQAILSGNANFTGASSDGAGSNGVTSAPSGYHLVKAYTTKKGTVVKAHLVKNKATSSTAKTTTTSSSSSDWSASTVSHSTDVQQRSQISQQNFPGKTIGSDPTIIIGTH